MTEEWKDIEGYENLYQVSNMGRVRSFKQKAEGKILKNRDNGNGYLYVCLGRGNENKKYIHRLVAECFCEIPEGLKEYDINELEVDHKSGERFLNTYTNLRWCTRKENCNYELHRKKLSEALKGKESWNKGKTGIFSKTTLLRKSEKMKTHWKENKHPMLGKGTKVYQYSLDGTFIKEYTTIQEASNELNCTEELIRNVCNGKEHCNTALGYFWSYELLTPNDKIFDRFKEIKIKEFSKDGNLINIHKSLRYLESIGYNRQSIVGVCSGRNKTYMGKVWRYEQDNFETYNSKPNYHNDRTRKIIQFTMDGDLIRKWNSISDAYNSLCINKSSLSSCLLGKQKSAGGSKWEYYNTDRYLIALMNKTIKDREKKRVA